MAQGKNTVLVYTSWATMFEKLSDEEAGKLIKHFWLYVTDKNPIAPDRLTELLFEPIKTTLKSDLAKYESIREKNKENVMKRWYKDDTSVYDRIPLIPNDTHIDIDNDIVYDNVNKKDNNNIFLCRDHLSITWDEMNKLIDKYGEQVATDMVNRVLNYRKNSKYKSLYLTALEWIKKDIEKQKPKLNGERQKPKLAGT